MIEFFVQSVSRSTPTEQFQLLLGAFCLVVGVVWGLVEAFGSWRARRG